MRLLMLQSKPPRVGLVWYVYFILLALAALTALTGFLTYTFMPDSLADDKALVVELFLDSTIYTGIVAAILAVTSLPYFAVRNRKQVVAWTVIVLLAVLSLTYLVWAIPLIQE
jgi:hypothetical protein